MQRGATVVDLGDVRSLQPSWTTLLGVFPVFCNSLSVHTAQGQEHIYGLVDHSAWTHAIGVAMAA